jgi:DNA mismatch repair protein MSH2
LSVAAAKAFLRDALTSKQMRIEIWKGGGKRSNSWKVDRQVSRVAGGRRHLEL